VYHEVRLGTSRGCGVGWLRGVGGCQLSDPFFSDEGIKVCCVTAKIMFFCRLGARSDMLSPFQRGDTLIPFPSSWTTCRCTCCARIVDMRQR